MLFDQGGRFQSVRTDDEYVDLFLKEIESIPPDERQFALEVLNDFLVGKTSPALELSVQSVYKTVPVKMEEFLNNPFYLGSFSKTIFPVIKSDLIEIFEGGYSQAIFGGSLGGGKTTAGVIGILRMIYEVSCLHSPHEIYKISSSDYISFPCVSTTEAVAERNIIDKIRAIVSDSEYFHRHFKPEKMSMAQGIIFPNRIIIPPGASTSQQIVGSNAMGCFVDECVVDVTEILLYDGSTITAKDWIDSGGSRVLASFDFESGEMVPAEGFIKHSAIQDVYELEIETKKRIHTISGFSYDHPVLTPSGFIATDNLNIGDEVYLYGQKTNSLERREKEGSFGDLQEKVSRRNLLNSSTTRMGGRSSLQRENETSQAREKDVFRFQNEDVFSKTRETHAFGRIQKSSCGEKQEVKNRVQTFGRNQAEAQREQLLAEGSGGLGLPGLSQDDQWYWQGQTVRNHMRWISEYLRIESYRNNRFGSKRENGSVRALRGSVAWWVLHCAGFFSDFFGRFREGYRGEATHLYSKSARKEKIRRCNQILPTEWNDVRDLGRDQTLGIIRQKKYLGKKLTYSVAVPGREAFVADGVIVHNTNFFQNRQQNTDRAGDTKEGVEVIYESIKRRMESRFLNQGRLPGVILICSSKTSPNSFTERLINKHKDDPRTYVKERAVWETVPKGRFSGKTFKVAIGDETRMSKILVEGEQEPEGMNVIDVPVEFRQAFEDDIDMSIRDYAGRSTVSIAPFIGKREKIYECVDKSRSHPFNQEVWEQNLPGRIDWSKLCRLKPDGTYEPLHHPHAPRHIHLDLSKNQDRTGITVSCVGGYAPVNRFGKTDTEMAPIIHVDFMIAIQAPRGGEILYSEIRKLIYEFSSHGFFIKLVSADQFQSLSLLQAMRQQGYKTEIVSVEPAGGPYELLKQALYENRISMYHYAPIIKELRELQKNSKTGKVDHPDAAQGGRKDISDSLAACIATLTKSAYGITDEPVVNRHADLFQENEDQWVLGEMLAVDSGGGEDVEWRNNVDTGQNVNSGPEWRQNAEKALEQQGTSNYDWKRNFTMPFMTG
jgi:hypothetical protein